MSRGLALAAIALASAALAVGTVALSRIPSRTAAGASGPAAMARISAIEERLAALERPGGPPAERSSLLDEVVSAGTGPPGGPERTPEELRATAEAFIKAAIAEELEARAAAEKKDGAAPGAEKKPSLSQFGALLDLDEGQRSAVHAAVVKGQEELIAILRTPTAGGRVPLDDLLDALLGKPEEMQPRMIEIFTMLGTEKVPGSGETYGQRSEALKRGVSESFRRQFRAEQFKEYERMGQDPLEIQVPDSPWLEVLKQAVERRK